MAIVNGKAIRAKDNRRYKAIPDKDWLALKTHLGGRSDVKGMLLYLLQCTGCRVDELCKVDIEDVKTALKDGKLFISASKNSHDRWIRGVPEKLLLMLNDLSPLLPKNKPIAWLLAKNSQSDNKQSWIRTLQRELSRTCTILGIKHYNPHAFRHTFCLKLLKASNNNVAMVQKLIGHKAISNTAVYLESIETDDSEERMMRQFG